MSFVGRNHPQQVATRGPLDEIDDRTTPWDFYGPRIEFLKGRLRFLKPGQTEILPNERPPFGCLLAIWDKRPTLPGLEVVA